MSTILQTLETAITQGLPLLLGALLVLLAGFVVALILRAITHSLLDRTRIDERLDRRIGGTPDTISIRNLAGQIVFWLVMLFAIASALDILNLTVIAEPFDNIFNRAIGYVPNLFSAALLAGLAWIIATLAKKLLRRLLDSTNVDERLTRSARMEQRVPLSSSLSTLIYWLIWFLFLPAILDALDMEGILRPVEGLLQDVLAFLPNLFSAAVIIVIGYFVARIVRDIVTNLLASTGLDSFGARFGFTSTSTGETTPQQTVDTGDATTEPETADAGATSSMGLSRVIGLLVYVLILIPVGIAALDALNMEAISEPAIEMLNGVLNVIPAIFAAGILIVLSYFVSRFVGDLVARLLSGMGLNRFLNQIGVTRVTGERQPSAIVGLIVMIAIMLFAATEAAELLGFEAIAVMIANFLGFFGNVVLGLIVLALGLYLANLGDQTIRSSGIQNSGVLATVARYAVLLLALTMALRQMGIAEDIITLAFGLLLGSVAVAAAIAFGWGGRELARQQLQKLEANLQDSSSEQARKS